VIAKGGTELIADERMRQMLQEGWTLDHDDEHDYGELSIAAACYAVEGTDARVVEGICDPLDAWPWNREWDKRKKHDRLRRLVIAGALIAAEIDRELRARDRKKT